jgi:sugar O-acyltransferase (sialic acid O-acetyltransferase NeuD family)
MITASDQTEPPLTAVVLGGGMQARLLTDLIEWSGRSTAGLRFFDDRVHTGVVAPNGTQLAGTLADGLHYVLASKSPTIIALGSRMAALRHHIRMILEANDVPLPSIIHPSVIIAPSARISHSVLVFPGSVIGPRVTVGPGTVLFNHCTLEHDTSVAENVWLAPGVTTSGFVSIGPHCFIGCRSVLSRECRVAECVLVAAGAVVVHDLPPEHIAMGVPAKARNLLRSDMDAPLKSQIAIENAAPWLHACFSSAT